MKALLQEFWVNPVKKRWFIIANIALFGLFYLAYYFLDKHINPWASVGLLFLALIFEVTAIGFLAPAQLKEMWQDLLSDIRSANRNTRYYHYQIKHKDKDYKEPGWNDEEFTKTKKLEDRVAAFVQASIDFQQADFEAWKRKNIGINLDSRDHTITRSFLIIFAAIVSFLLLLGLLTWLGFDSAKIRELIENSKGTVLLGIFTTFIGAPVIFIVWLFRDKNNRIQIENARKDTNLKDFQKLSEWASGFHLPEIKKSSSSKNIIKRKLGEPKEFISETLATIEDLASPSGSTNINRRQGAEALQASAIAQLEAFMFGKYGVQFMHPAFLLVHAIWESIITQQQEKYNNSKDIQQALKQLHMSPIVSALNRALAGANGFHLCLFKNSLQGINLTALDSNGPALSGLNLNNYRMNGINLSYASLSRSNFIASDLTSSNLSHISAKNIILTRGYLSEANLSHSTLVSSKIINSMLINANLQSVRWEECDVSKANLSRANLSRAIFRDCNFSEAILFGANLTEASLSNANLNGADLSNCLISDTTLYNADLSNSNLKNAVFYTTKYQQAKFKDCQINKTTTFNDNDFKALNYILSRGAIWDDDPEWLVGKIQDAALLEKIRQDCAERAKLKGA